MALGLTVVPWGGSGIEVSASDVRSLHDDYPDLGLTLSIADARSVET